MPHVYSTVLGRLPDLILMAGGITVSPVPYCLLIRTHRTPRLL